MLSSTLTSKDQITTPVALRCAFYFALTVFLSSTLVYADTTTTKTASAESMIGNLTETVAELKKQTTLSVYYPTKLPVSEKQNQLYASITSYADNPDYNRYWVINFDTTPDCQGKRFCNVGSIIAEKSGKLEKSYTTLPDRKEHPKQQVKLAKKLKGYYTPSHVEAGSVGPTIQWQADNVLYTLEWRDMYIKTSKEVLTEMADSAVKSKT